MFRLNDGENIGFFHNKIVFPIDVDFGAGIFSIQYAITDFDGHGFILFAVTDGDYSAFLRFFLLPISVFENFTDVLNRP